MYYKESTKETPIVSLNSEKGVLLIDGNCESETPDEFFTEISDWINNYSKKPQETTTLTINLGGINICLLYTSPSPRDKRQSRMPSSA